MGARRRMSASGRIVTVAMGQPLDGLWTEDCQTNIASIIK